MKVQNLSNNKYFLVAKTTKNSESLSINLSQEQKRKKYYSNMAYTW